MNTKKLDEALDISLWVVFGLLVIGSFFFCRTIKAPEYEVVETSVKIPYVYTSKDGERFDSYYVPAWKHERFKRPKVAVYDPKTGSSSDLKPEYVAEYKAQMPKTEYPFYTRWTDVIFVILAIFVAIFTYLVGGYFRDMILFLKLRKNSSFTECAYFLYEDRIGFTNSVKSLIGRNVGVYIDTKSQELYNRYREDFATLLVHILNSVKANNDTDIAYDLTFRNLTKDQKTYLKELRSYWDGQIGKNVYAEENVKYINTLIEKKYLNVKLLVDENTVSTAVSRQLGKLFTDILGSEVLRFSSDKSASGKFYKALKSSDRISIDINVRNHHKYFTWSGSAVPDDTAIPGLEIEFKIFHYVDRVEKILWDKFLVPVCKYEAKDEEFALSELYKSMLLDTISTFDNSAKVK